MKTENIETVKFLIYQRITLEKVIDRAERWEKGHFEFTEHYGSNSERISINYFPELTMKMLALIEEEIGNIDKELEKL